MKKNYIKPMSVDLELNKFLELNKYNWSSWHTICVNGLGEPLRVEWRSCGLRDVIKAMKIVFKAQTVSGRHMYGKNYRYITVYTKNNTIVIDTSKEMYMSQHTGDFDEVMKEHQKERTIEMIDSQIAELTKRKKELQ